jgi:hypothetical protein
MYFHSESVTELVSVALDPSDDVGGNLFRAYEALEKKGIVYSGELTALEAWLKDMSEMI